MRLIIQRVNEAKALVKNEIIGQIGQGLLIFLGVGKGDKLKMKKIDSFGMEKLKNLANKILNLRIFGDKNNKMNLSILDIKGEILVIPQFTLFADCSKGNRPFFGEAARPETAKPLFEKFVKELKKSGLKVEKGEFGAKMEVELVNDGPVTIILNSNG